jgi:PAS domain S-box-containing protein
LRILLVEDSEADAELIADELARAGYAPEVRCVASRGAAERALAERWDVAVSDYSVPGFGALPFLALLKERGLDLPTIVASGSVGEEELVEAMRAGAHDYVFKTNLARLGHAVRRGIADAAARQAQRAAEKALRDSEERFRFVIEHTGDVLYRLRYGTMTYDYMSPGIERLTGYTQDEINELGLASLVISISGPAASHVVREEVREGRLQSASYEFWADYRVRTRSGEVRWVADHSLPWTDAEGKVVGSIGILSDITRRKEAEEALRSSEARVRTILDSALDAVIGMDEAGRATYWNPRAEAIFGWSRSEAVGRAVPDLILSGRHRDGYVAGIESFLKTGTSPVLDRRLQLDCLRRDGTEFPVELMVTAVRQRDSWSFHAFAADISDRKRAEEALRRSEEHFRSLIENALDIISELDADGTVRYESPAVERVLGYGPAELLGRSLLDLVHPDDLAVFREFLAKAAARPGLVASAEARLRHRDGSWRFFEAVGRAESSGTLVIVNSRDVTDRHHLERQLRQSQKLEAVGRLAGGVAHDFNNLITAISGYAELGLRRIDAADPLARNLGEIRKAADRAASLTRQLLAFGRKQVLKPRVLDLAGTVEQVEDLLRRLVGEGVTLEIAVEERSARVRADPVQLEQVLLNLVINARDAMPAGGRVTLRIRGTEVGGPGSDELPPGPYVVLEVSDTGQGIGPESLPHIFEPFFTTKEVGAGTGLGLSTVYGIVKQSGGNVTVDSEPGRGAVFRVYLPRVDEPPPAAAAEAGSVLGRAGSETVLLVEDEAAIREMLREILTEEGYKVLSAASPEEALRAAREAPGTIHVLVSDVVMPVMSGPELAARITEVRPGLKVLYMSGYTSPAVSDLVAARAFLQKPFPPAALTAKVRELLDS